MTGTILHNTVPINIEGRWTFLTYNRYQCIEEYPYTSLPGPAYGCPSSANHWELEVGALPPGLSLDKTTGVISGTSTRVLGPNFLVRLLEAHPNPIPTGQVANAQVTPASYALTPEIAGPDAKVVVSYNFSIRGYDYTVAPDEEPGVLLPCTIMVLKNWRGDVEDWKEWEQYYDERAPGNA